MSEMYPFAVSILIGLVIGIERERSHSVDIESAGVRTFILLAVLGTLAATLGSQIVFVLSAFAAAIVIAGYWRSTRHGAGTGLGYTTEVSAMLTYGLGYLSQSNQTLSLVLGLTTFAVLYSRTWLHRFARDVLQTGEIRALLILATLLIGVMPILPADALDPWGLLHLRNLAKVIGALAAVQFTSHVAIRAFGAKLGIMVTGFFAGFVSSTAVFATLPSRYKAHPAFISYFYAAGFLATAASLIESLGVLALIELRLFYVFFVPILVMVATALIAAWSFGRNLATVAPVAVVKAIALESAVATSNPLDLTSVLKLSAVISTVLILVSVSNKWLGPTAASATAFLGALLELQGVIYSTADLFLHSDITKDSAIVNVALAVAASVFSKMLILCLMSRSRFALVLSGILAVMVAMGAGTLLLTLRAFNSV